VCFGDSLYILLEYTYRYTPVVYIVSLQNTRPTERHGDMHVYICIYIYIFESPKKKKRHALLKEYTEYTALYPRPGAKGRITFHQLRSPGSK